MPQRELTVFRTSCLAASIAALSACSTTPRGPDAGSGPEAPTGVNVFGSIAEAGARTWDRTRYLLGLDGGEAAQSADARTRDARTRGERQLLDEVDLALMEEDAVMPDEARASAVVRSSAWSDISGTEGPDGSPGVARSDDGLLASTPDEAFGSPDGAVVTPLGAAEPLAPGEALEPMPADAAVVVARDLTHRVDAEETLWDIAKATTGDATNWHVLADVNDLGPGAAVYPGQELVIPADMVRPELADSDLSELADLADLADPNGDAELSAEDDGARIARDETLSEPDEASASARLAVPARGDAAALSAADAATGPTADMAADMATGPTTGFELDEGETLWDFAKRTTGDATNWQALAAANAFSESEATRVRPGQTILVPEDMIRPELAAGTGVAAALPAAEAADTSEASVTRTASVATGREAMRMVPIEDAPGVATPGVAASTLADAADESVSPVDEAIDSVLDETRPIRIVEAAYRAEPEEATAAAATLDQPGDVPAEVMISGTYYPKAVYNAADFSASLLMRVSPGTKLQVSRAVGQWYEVQTDNGTGFVHARDVR